jgi:hypothetical protein
MSKERARRREARQREAAIRRAAQVRAAERAARQRARRRRTRLNLVVAALLFTQVVVWVVRPDWQARLAALLVAALAFPVIAAFTL